MQKEAESFSIYYKSFRLVPRIFLHIGFGSLMPFVVHSLWYNIRFTGLNKFIWLFFGTPFTVYCFYIAFYYIRASVLKQAVVEVDKEAIRYRTPFGTKSVSWNEIGSFVTQEVFGRYITTTYVWVQSNITPPEFLLRIDTYSLEIKPAELLALLEAFAARRTSH